MFCDHNTTGVRAAHTISKQKMFSLMMNTKHTSAERIQQILHTNNLFLEHQTWHVCMTQGMDSSAYHWAISLDLALPKPRLGPLSGSKS